MYFHTLILACTDT